MLKQRIATGLLLATAVTSLTAASAFAAEQSDADKMLAATVSIAAHNGEAQDPNAPKLDLKTDEDGNQYLENEDGSRVYFSQATPAEGAKGAENPDGVEVQISYSTSDSEDANENVELPDVKTDENGDRYIEMEDGARVYIMMKNAE